MEKQNNETMKHWNWNIGTIELWNNGTMELEQGTMQQWNNATME